MPRISNERIEEAYQEYTKRFHKESVCNHKEMNAILSDMKDTLTLGHILMMANRVGEPGTTKKMANDKWPTFMELPRNA